jgi:glutamine phosphoribosylpyrophosphate amidotransferase
VIIDKDRCAFNIIYTIDGSHSIDDELVSFIRKKIALAFSKKIIEDGINYDYVVPIPNTGKLYSRYIAKFIRAKHLNIFKKISDKRTLGLDGKSRNEFYNTGLQIINSVPKNSKVLFIDEALISGLTTLKIAHEAHKIGLKSYSFGYMSPPINGFCPWGNIKNTDRYFDGIRNSSSINIMIEKIRKKSGANSIKFITNLDFLGAISGERTCSLCFKQC